MSLLDAADLANPVWALLDALEHVNTYDGEFVDAGGRPVSPPADDDGRVHAYAVFYPSAGHLMSVQLDAEPDSLDWTFQVTCAAADRVRAMWCVGQVRSVLTGAWVNFNGQPLQIRETGNPGPIRRDEQVKPPRFYLPLSYAVTT